MAHESSTFNSESAGLFFFFHRWNPAQRPRRGWKNQGYFPVDWFLSMRNRVIRLATFASCVSFLSPLFVYARLDIVSVWNFQVSFPLPPLLFFFSLLAMLARLVKTPKEPRGNVFEAKKLCKNLSVLFCSSPSRLLLFAFYTRLCLLDFWIFEKPRCKSKFSSELRLKFQMFRNWWYLDVEDLND